MLSEHYISMLQCQAQSGLVEDERRHHEINEADGHIRIILFDTALETANRVFRCVNSLINWRGLVQLE